MQDADFEEKEYETPLVNQLLSGSPFIWSPGQVFEQFFGIDAALWALHPRIWELLGCRSAPIGVVLDSVLWTNFWTLRRPRRNRPMPNFAVNLLVQTKRPQYLQGVNSKLARLGIKGSYWRFKITSHQQSILERLSSKLRSRVVVTYACAAFHTLKELYHHTEKGRMVDESTFVRATRLRNHMKWAYDQPGCRGVACSEMEVIEDKPFGTQIEQAAEQATQDASQDPDRAARNLKVLSSRAIEVCKVESEAENPISREYFRRLKVLEERIPMETPKRQYIVEFLRFAVLVDLVGGDWFVVGNAKKR